MKTLVPLVVALLLLAFACASPREAADDAFARGDWPRAAREYARALQRANHPAEVAALRERLEACLQEAAFEFLQQARRVFEAGRYEAALKEVESSLWYKPLPSADLLAEDIRQAWAADYRARGTASLSAGDPIAAERHLLEAERIHPTRQGTALLAEARQRADEIRGRTFESAVAAAGEARQRRQWTRAVFLYERAHAHRRTPVSTREANFCDHMMKAERFAALRRFGEARGMFHAALATRLDSGHVKERIRATLPLRFMVQVHSATLLPYRPGTDKAWDGVNTIAAPDLFAKGFAYYHTGDVLDRVTELARIIEDLEIGFRKPDCYFVLALPDQSFGGASVTVDDDLNPVWDRWFELTGTLEDPTPVRITIMNRGMATHQVVGTWETTIGALREIDGKKLLILFDREGNLKAGGVLVLRLAVKLLG